MANNNKEQLSIAQVFGEKSKDGDDMKQNLGMLLSQLIQPREIRRRESEYPKEDYGVLEDYELETLKNAFGTEQFEGDPYEFLEKKGILTTDISKRDEKYWEENKELLNILSNFSPHGWGYSGNPLIAHEKQVEQELDWEKPTHISKQTMGREDLMYPMEKGKGLMALLQRLLPGGKTGMDVARHPTRESFEAVWQSQNPKNK